MLHSRLLLAAALPAVALVAADKWRVCTWLATMENVEGVGLTLGRLSVIRRRLLQGGHRCRVQWLRELQTPGGHLPHLPDPRQRRHPGVKYHYVPVSHIYLYSTTGEEGGGCLILKGVKGGYVWDTT